jgi:hypothetical protein
LKNSSYVETLLFEHRFWLQILGDHARFIFTSLAPNEVDTIKEAKEFITLFDDLLCTARSNINKNELNEFTLITYKMSNKLRTFKLTLIERLISKRINIHLTPVFINHMVNELEEYIRIQELWMEDKDLNTTPLHYHMLWLQDGFGHAYAIASNLDMIEKQQIRISENFAKDFTDLYIKSVELAGFTRTGLCSFPSLDRLNEDAHKKMNLFMNFLKELKQEISSKEILSILMPLMLDHMYREECYYLTKLSMVSKVPCPNCKPDRPRENM